MDSGSDDSSDEDVAVHVFQPKIGSSAYIMLAMSLMKTDKLQINFRHFSPGFGFCRMAEKESNYSSSQARGRNVS